MSRKVSDIFISEVEKPQQCDFCGKIAELRPYGPNGEAVCFQCGMKDRASAVRQFAKRLDVTDEALIAEVVEEMSDD